MRRVMMMGIGRACGSDFWHGLLRPGALLGVLASLTTVGFAIPATAGAKVTSITSCPSDFVPLSTPGKYRLDADLFSASSSDCFDIAGSNVTLLLNGHTISATTDDGIFVTGANDKIVGPGTITNFAGAGIEFFAADNGSVRGVKLTNNADGILFDHGSTGNDIKGNVATGNSLYGIVAFGPFAGVLGATGNTIIGNVAHNNGLFDLADFNNSCDNVWRGNDFGTANQSCIH